MNKIIGFFTNRYLVAGVVFLAVLGFVRRAANR